MTDEPRGPRDRKPQLELLESMTLLSGLAFLAAIDPSTSAIVQSSQRAPIALNATTHGTLTTTQKNPDAGKEFQLYTSGPAAALGHVSIDGALLTPGFIAHSQASGSLKVHTRRGELTLSVKEPSQFGFSSLPHSLTYSITSGTGHYQGATGSGRLTITTAAASPTAALSLSTNSRVSLVFRSGPLI